MKGAFLLLTAMLLGVSLVQPPFPKEQSLQHLPTVIGIALLSADLRREWLSRAAFLCVIAFLWLHILGARYIYSYVPYDEILLSWTGFSPSLEFGWTRNNYDRLVHFGFGALFIAPCAGLASRWGKLDRGWEIAFALCAVTAMSGVYEVLEWLLAVVMAPDVAEAYNGQQGDHWDAQKDIAIALLGSLLVLPIAYLTRRRS
ncbi:MAG: DUF2238 domain-containing protein [Planctomycetaceae bacterium]